MATLTPVEQRMIDHFVERVKDSKLNPRIDNASLYAGSPMYYYCGECGAFITSLPECHSGPAPHTCNSCKKLEDGELMVEARKAAETAGLEVHYGQSDGYGEVEREVYLGKSWSSIGEDETGRQFKAAVEAAVKELIGEAENGFSTIEEAYYNG